MHIALIMDEDRLTVEQPTLNRLTVGLIGEGLKVTRIVPESMVGHEAGLHERRIALAARIDVPMTVLPWTRRERIVKVMSALERGLPDVFFALGEGAWTLGLELARAIEKPLVLEVCSAMQARSAPRGRRARAVAGYLAPTRPIASVLRERVDADLVCLLSIGVAMPAQPRSVLGSIEKSIGLVVVGSGRDVPGYRALLEGLSRVLRDFPQTQVFLELAGPNEHEIWRAARRLELLEQVSTMTSAARHRALLTRCDVMLLPERFGEVRSIVLEAMAYGMPVIAAEDSFLDFLEHDSSAAIVEEGEPDGWARHLRRLLTEPETARRIGLGGRERIAAGHRSSDQVNRLIETFERIARGGAYRFDPPAATE